MWSWRVHRLSYGETIEERRVLGIFCGPQRPSELDVRDFLNQRIEFIVESEVGRGYKGITPEIVKFYGRVF